MPDEQKLPSGPCLEPEVLAAYVERTLTSDERARAEAHLAECGDCYALLTEVLRTIDEMDGRVEPQEDPAPSVAEPPTIVRPTFGRRRVWMVAGGLLAAAATILVVVRLQPALWPQRADQRVAKLVSAVGEERYTEARLTGGFKYGPLRASTRSTDVTPIDNLGLLAAAAELQQAAQTTSDAATRHAWGVAQLLIGRHDDAILNLEGAVVSGREDATLHSDLAAAYLTRALRANSAPDLPRALASVQRALQLEPTLREALFNRALILQALSLTEEARSAFEEYLRLDATSAWADEARRQLAGLQRSTRF